MRLARRPGVAPTWRLAVLVVLAGAPGVAAVAPGDLVVVDPRATSAILRVDLLSGLRTAIGEGPLQASEATGVVVGHDGGIYVTTCRSVLRVDPESGERNVLATTGFTSACHVTVDADASLLVADPLGAAVVRVDPTTGAATPVASGGDIGFPTGIAVGADGLVYLTDGLDNEVVRVDPSTRTSTVLTSDLAGPVAVAAAASGDLYVLNDDGGTVVRIDPLSGITTTVAEVPGAQASGIAVARDGTVFVLTDALYRLRTDGGRDLVTGNFATEAGPLLSLAIASSCGDGMVDPFEDCDDGNRLDGDCCSTSCRFEPSTAACADDGNPCTVDRCDDRGACTHPAGNAGSICNPRDPTDSCDVDDACDGATAQCPQDATPPCHVTVPEPAPGARATRIACELPNDTAAAGARCNAEGTAEPAQGATARDDAATPPGERVTRPIARAQQRVRLRRGRSARLALLNLRLNQRGRDLLRERGELRVVVVVTISRRDGTTGRSDATVTFRP